MKATYKVTAYTNDRNYDGPGLEYNTLQEAYREAVKWKQDENIVEIDLSDDDDVLKTWRLSRDCLLVENLVVFKEDILDWLEGNDAFDGFYSLNFKTVKELIENILVEHMFDDETRTYFHNPIKREFYEVRNESDLDWIVREILERYGES